MILSLFFYLPQHLLGALSRSIGVFGKGAEIGNTFKKSGRLHVRFDIMATTFWAVRFTTIITFQDQTLKGMITLRAFVFNGRHVKTLPSPAAQCNSKGA